MRAPRRKTIGGALLAGLVLASVALAGNGLSGSTAKGPTPEGMTVGYSYNNDVSAAVRSVHPTPVKPSAKRAKPEMPPLFKSYRIASDPVVQRTKASANMPSPILNFDGIPYPGVVCFCAPPDTNGEVGLTQYVQIVNEGFQVFNKNTGASELGPVAISSLWQGFGGLCEFNGFGDPVVVYDQLAQRWVITQFAGNYPSTPITDQCIAVSTSSDATGSYNRYGFHMTDDFYDYPKFGVWPDAYYASANIFNASGTAFLGPQAFAFDRAAMLAGNPATFIAAPRGSSTDDAFMPADLDGLSLPPAGAPNPYQSVGTNATWPLHRFHVDFANPANSTWTLAGTLTPAPFTVLFALVPQLGTGDGLDSLADRGMFRSAYRNFGDHEALVGNMTVSSGGVAGVRWFEINNATSGSPSFVQQSTYQPDDTWRWMGSAAMDNDGNLAVGFSASSALIHPQVRYARLATDPPNTLAQGEEHLFDGAGSQTDTVSRWGDYSDMTVDPVGDCTFWYTQEYYQTTSSFNWRTRIGNFRFPNCTDQLSGTLQGTVTDSANNPISGAQVSVAPLGASTVTDATGHYSLILPVGTYDVTASAFGYQSQTVNGVVITDGGTTTQDFHLQQAPSHSLSGTVSDASSNPLAGATVTILGTPIPPETTDANGHYSFASVPDGAYDVRAQAGRCNEAQTQHVVISSDTTLDFTLPQRHDNFGYFCQVVTPNYIEGDTALSLSGDDSSTSVNLPFGFAFYGQTYNTAYVCTNGHLTFVNPGSFCPFSNGSIPSAGTPNAAIYPFWDDLYVIPGDSTMWTKLQGSAPNRQFVIEWRNVAFFGDFSRRIDVEVVLYENGRILTQYRNIADDGRERGNSATLGIENAAGNDALQYSFNEATIGTPDFAVLYRLPPNGFVEGHVTDANDHLAVGGATVKAMQSGNVIRQTTTDANGFYRMQLFVGDYTIEASKTNYETASANITINEDQTTTQDFSLRTARGEVSPTSLEFIVPPDQVRTKTIRLSNTGGLPMTWDVKESGGGAALPSRADQGSKLTKIELSKDERADPGWLGNRAPSNAPRVDAGSPLAPTWSSIANYPSPIMDNSAAFIDGKEYVVGGFNFNVGVTNMGNVYDPATNTWAPIANMPVAREKPGVAAVNGLLYVTGGWDSGGTPIARTDVYDPSSNSWSTVAPNPSPTAAPGVAVANGNIYVVGGCADSFCTPSAHVGRYDPSSDSWATVASYPTTDSWESCGGINGQVYCAGGVSGGTTFRSGNVYNPGSDSWSPIADMPIDLWGSVYGAANQMLVVSSGVTNGFSTVTNQGFTYDPSADSWTALPNAQFPRYRAGGSCGFYKIGGSSAGFTPTPDSEKLSELDQCAEFTDVPWLSESPDNGTINPGGHTDVQVTVDTHGLSPGVYAARLTFRTNSGRKPNLAVPVRLIVPAYYQAVNAGNGAYTDLGGDPWAADQQYTAGSWGYTNSSSHTFSTRRAIGGTDDDKLYQSQRQDPTEYRFDGLPNGMYEFDLRFAELQNRQPGTRLFDVIIENNLVLPSHDVAGEVGGFYADQHVFFMPVTDGQANIRFVGRAGSAQPIVNAIRVRHRPDR
jgi:N-acetylneuraminic acid mutarotase